MLGSFVLVLHGHLPWVLNHGRRPHGVHWLYEAALETWLPLLGVVQDLAAHGVHAKFTLGLTPVLLEQLSTDAFKDGLDAYIEGLLQQARLDGADPRFALLAARWEGLLLDHRERFRAASRDLVGAFADAARAGHLEILSSFATHGYAPLLLHDASVRAQLAVGLETSERHLGFRPRGLWLPECAFRPAGPWTPPALHADVRNRAGVDRILEEQGVTHFFVDAHAFQGIRSEGVIERGAFRKVDWGEAERYPGRGWRSVVEPHWINTLGQASAVAAFARHPAVSEQVWSADVGYPGDPRYLEFHKRLTDDGLRYWRVTRRSADLGEKEMYRPEEVAAATYEHAQHFAATVRRELAEHKRLTGREGCVTATFDAELFGHWWHEGPQFLRDLLLALHHDPDVIVETADERLRRAPPDKVGWLPEGSWGAGGDHQVWLNETLKWTWEAAYRAEDRLLGLLWDLHGAGSPPAAAALARSAARELLLLQASDWNFVITTGGAVDYGYARFCGHLTRFDRLATMAHDVMHGRGVTPLQELQAAEADAHDTCFAQLSLRSWDDRLQG